MRTAPSTWLRPLHPLLAFGALASAAPAAAAPKTPPGPAPERVDVAARRDQLVVLTDGKKHYLVVDGQKLEDDSYFWGDASAVYQLRIYSGGGEKNADDTWKKRSVSFWEPRVAAGWQASVDLDDGGGWSVQCNDRKTKLQKVEGDAAKAILDKARFHKARWPRRAYALARDEKGRYYYVDRMREPEGNTNFRLFVGPKGNLKPMKMTNVVSDSEGDIFATRSGELRLILNKGDLSWVAGKDRTKLVHVPVEDNHVMIYTDLGPYSGEALGTPCDDL